MSEKHDRNQGKMMCSKCGNMTLAKNKLKARIALYPAAVGIPAGDFRYAWLYCIVCLNCGYVETWATPKGLQRLRNYIEKQS